MLGSFPGPSVRGKCQHRYAHVHRGNKNKHHLHGRLHRIFELKPVCWVLKYAIVKWWLMKLLTLGLTYLKDFLLLYHLACQLRSSSQALFSVPLLSEVRQAAIRDGVFSVVAPCLGWECGVPVTPLKQENCLFLSVKMSVLSQVMMRGAWNLVCCVTADLIGTHKHCGWPHYWHLNISWEINLSAPVSCHLFLLNKGSSYNNNKKSLVVVKIPFHSFVLFVGSSGSHNY